MELTFGIGISDRRLDSFSSSNALRIASSRFSHDEVKVDGVWCFGELFELYSFHINCGGKEVNGDEKPRYKYEDDTTNPGGPSKFFQSGSNWGFSSTGHFLDNEVRKETYIESNNPVLRGNNLDLYKDARLSPLSLTYYGYCLRDGNYTVNLHFAEIMFTDDKNYSSLGRRVFNIYIQMSTFHFFVQRTDVERADSSPSSGISAGAVVGIVVGIACAIFLLLGVLWWKGCLPLKDTMGLAHQLTRYLRQI
ncbi:LOW QUALITY PROTEIN: hypothetical protein RJ640_018141 [Escallonia rubra]|uniref:Malectin domain-containing protein n=1 Tax=Escallonia rubra TaxID=112253 RepID=A0AA88RN83_9ASTE|nr:LOW QUALITY PROTEIN: hypothetical protein RJ640_018141 [Escallonia rubra]